MQGKHHTIHGGDGGTCDGLAFYPEPGNKITFSRLHAAKNEIKWRQFCWKGLNIESKPSLFKFLERTYPNWWWNPLPNWTCTRTKFFKRGRWTFSCFVQEIVWWVLVTMETTRYAMLWRRYCTAMFSDEVMASNLNSHISIAHLMSFTYYYIVFSFLIFPNWCPQISKGFFFPG